MSDGLFTAFLQQIPSTIQIPDEHLDYCALNLKSVNLARGQRLVSPGDSGNIFAFVAKGLFKRFLLTPDGAEIILSFDEEGRLISDFPALLSGKSAQLFIEAMEESVCLISSPGLAHNLKQRHVSWKDAWAFVTEIRYLEEHRRVIELLSFTAEGRYAQFIERYANLASRIPNKDIAAYLGITPSSFSRLMAKERP